MGQLIINADDFGMSKIYNDHIIQLLSTWKITSTTVMVNRITDTQAAAVSMLKELNATSGISVGLHVEFTYDRHLQQVDAQYDTFMEIFETPPSHLDVHKEHLHREYHSIVADFCREKRLPFRNHGKRYKDVRTTDHKYFYGSVEDFSVIDTWLQSIEHNQNYELVFHPGAYDPDCYSSLNREREWDVDHIGHIHENQKKYQIKLISYNDLNVSPILP